MYRVLLIELYNEFQCKILHRHKYQRINKDIAGHYMSHRNRKEIFICKNMLKSLLQVGVYTKSTIFASDNTNLNFTTMAYVITDDCVACGTCIDECPQGAISEGEKYSINPDLCIDCGSCAGVCPQEAIIEG